MEYLNYALVSAMRPQT